MTEYARKATTLNSRPFTLAYNESIDVSVGAHNFSGYDEATGSPFTVALTVSNTGKLYYCADPLNINNWSWTELTVKNFCVGDNFVFAYSANEVYNSKDGKIWERDAHFDASFGDINAIKYVEGLYYAYSAQKLDVKTLDGTWKTALGAAGSAINIWYSTPLELYILTTTTGSYYSVDGVTFSQFMYGDSRFVTQIIDGISFKDRYFCITDYGVYEITKEGEAYTVSLSFVMPLGNTIYIVRGHYNLMFVVMSKNGYAYYTTDGDNYSQCILPYKPAENINLTFCLHSDRALFAGVQVAEDGSKIILMYTTNGEEWLQFYMTYSVVLSAQIVYNYLALLIQGRVLYLGAVNFKPYIMHELAVPSYCTDLFVYDYAISLASRNTQQVFISGEQEEQMRQFILYEEPFVYSAPAKPKWLAKQIYGDISSALYNAFNALFEKNGGAFITRMLNLSLLPADIDSDKGLLDNEVQNLAQIFDVFRPYVLQLSLNDLRYAMDGQRYTQSWIDSHGYGDVNISTVGGRFTDTLKQQEQKEQGVNKIPMPAKTWFQLLLDAIAVRRTRSLSSIATFIEHTMQNSTEYEIGFIGSNATENYISSDLYITLPFDFSDTYEYLQEAFNAVFTTSPRVYVSVRNQ